MIEVEDVFQSVTQTYSEKEKSECSQQEPFNVGIIVRVIIVKCKLMSHERCSVNITQGWGRAKTRRANFSNPCGCLQARNSINPLSFKLRLCNHLKLRVRSFGAILAILIQV